MAAHLWAVILVLIASVITALGPIYLKKSTDNGFSFKPKKLAKNKCLIKGSILYLASTCIFIPALKGGHVSVLYPIASTTYIWVCLLSTKMLGEKMNMMKWAGIALILLGVVFVSIGIG